MAEVNLLDCYPHSRRPIVARGKVKLARSGRLRLPQSENVTTQNLLLQQSLLQTARMFGREYFDGDRLYGYGGYHYDPKYWSKTARRLYEYYKLSSGDRVLDVGCAKGFLLYDIIRQYPELCISGIDISSYAIEHAHKDVKDYLEKGDATKLPYPDSSFDLVVSINTVSNPKLDECKQAIREIMRVSRGKSFISVHAWDTEEQRERLFKWNLTAMTCLHVDEWKKLFDEIGYKGEYYWSIV